MKIKKRTFFNLKDVKRVHVRVTPEEVEKLNNLVEEGYTSKEI